MSEADAADEVPLEQRPLAPEPLEPQQLTPAERRRALRSLMLDARIALLSEIGARALTDHLARRVRDVELRRLAVGLNEEGVALVAEVQQLIRDMGGSPRRTSLRRRALARILVTSRHVVGLRTVLRLLQHQEETLSRWYGEYAVFLARIGEPVRATSFEVLRATKLRRAQAVGTWVSNMARRMR
ncbi:MAG: hypothetical protein R3F49_03910 [Planctomycetota bacterium]